MGLEAETVSLCGELERVAGDKGEALGVLEKLAKLEMTVEVLKSTEAAIRIKKAIKAEDAAPELKAAGKKVIGRWRDAFLAAPEPAGASAPVPEAAAENPQAKKRVRDATRLLLETKANFIRDSEQKLRAEVKSYLARHHKELALDEAALFEAVRSAVTDYFAEQNGSVARKRVKLQLTQMAAMS